MKNITINDVFKYIERSMGEKSISFSTWHTSPMNEYYPVLEKIYNKQNPFVEYNGQSYMLTFDGSTQGMGGMSEGSPDTITVTKHTKQKPIKIEDITPQPLENPNWSNVLTNAGSVVSSVVKGSYNEDSDDAVFIFEAVMLAIYGKDFFEWMNKKTN